VANKEFRSFQKQWREEQKAFADEVLAKKQALTLFSIQMLIRFTPVLTGTLISGWNLGINRPDTAIHQLSTVKAVTARRLVSKTKQIKFKSSVFLTNEVPYGPLIEDDIHNNPARSMMVAKTISAIRAKFGNEVRITNVS